MVTHYLDLAQMAPRPLSQALDTQPSGKPGPPIPIALAPEALQAEIHHVLTTWEEIVREACRLTPVPDGRVRPGAAVQRAVAVLAPRMVELSKLGVREVYPTGCEDRETEVAGWEAALNLIRLDQRCRSMLGRTRRTTLLPGECSDCGAADLRRDEPREEGDDPPVYCGHCARTWTSAEYDRFVMLLVWPSRMVAA
jgi:hypothetical protein